MQIWEICEKKTGEFDAIAKVMDLRGHNTGTTNYYHDEVLITFIKVQMRLVSHLIACAFILGEKTVL